PLLRAGITITVLFAVAAAFLSTALVWLQAAQLTETVVFVIAMAASGVVTAVAWLAGQVFPRAAVPAALGILSLGLLTLGFPKVLPFTPWGWVGASFPGDGSHPLG